MEWRNYIKGKSEIYICGHCTNNVVAEVVSECWRKKGDKYEHTGRYIFICPGCKRPTFVELTGKGIIQIPGVKYGETIKNVPKDQDVLYHEARNSYAANAYTATVLICRKLLMHIAVDKGATEGSKFIEMVNYLDDNNIIPQSAKVWVDHIRTKGNESNHEIVLASKKEAENLIDFCAMLLKIVYEYPAMVPGNS